ncbi:MAG TPA: HAMP domain-containing sensor histidine kinase [Candidatus Limnocylindrales bacterium]|nr:HAMP domain-containing sensor histidine kinase [Candidatus Limnocylindrales bacterium]
MGDGTRLNPTDDGAEQAAQAEDARLIRRVRWRLVAWSGLTTLVVLLVLGGALYAVVAGSLQGASVEQLENRVEPWVRVMTGVGPDDDDRPSFGFLPGAGNTYLFAFNAQGNQVQLGRDPTPALQGLPEPASLDAARAAKDGRDVRTIDVSVGRTNFPARLLTQRVVYVEDGQTYFLQALQDRSTEVQTLQSLLVTLLVGGIVVVIAAFVVGAVYASRALVPIRQSLTAQRTALRRQREFAADASHELRTPLTVIRSSVEHLQRHQDRPVSASVDALEDIDAEVSHLTALVDDLLLLARSDSGAVALDRQTLDLGDVAFDAAGALGRAAEARGVRVVVDPEPAMIQGDPARLRQLVMILVDNAVRHSPRGGEVDVEVRDGATAASIEVRDQGPGVREEDMPHVFDRFWRAPGAPSGGTGLGLAIAKWIVDTHGGRIGVANRVDGGAAFRVELPALHPGQGAATGPEPAPWGRDTPA